jgi:acylphosphatase
MMASPVHRAFTVRGNVQGVGYRWFARDRASDAGLVGWVANEPDGSVRGEVSGAPDVVEQFIRALQQGPPASRVTGVSVNDLPPGTPVPATFEIRR